VSNDERAGVAHDLNNIIGVIAGYAELILDRSDDDAIRADATELLRVAQRGGALTRQLLTETAESDGPADANAVVIGIAPSLRQRVVGSAALDLDLQAHPSTVALGPLALERVVTNLVLNALHAVAGDGRVAVRTRTDADSRHVVIDVVDDGAGIDREAAARVFEPRFTTRGSSGNGLGLATVADIVRRAGGVVIVDSAVGEGTTVRVILPAPFVAA
jgi:two-component system cell cycle sensor histidine kinase/response regulator CckA